MYDRQTDRQGRTYFSILLSKFRQLLCKFVEFCTQICVVTEPTNTAWHSSTVISGRFSILIVKTTLLTGYIVQIVSHHADWGCCKLNLKYFDSWNFIRNSKPICENIESNKEIVNSIRISKLWCLKYCIHCFQILKVVVVVAVDKYITKKKYTTAQFLNDPG